MSDLFTPGPWKAVFNQSTIGTPVRSMIITEAHGIPVVSSVWGGPGNGECAVMEANAQLIAAAPELLAACQKEREAIEHYRRCDDCDQDDGHLCERATDLMEEAEALRIAAIAKATGASVP